MSNEKPTKPCRDCGRDIPVAARRCGHDNCGAFQDWRRYFGAQVSLVTLATAVGVAVTLLLNMLQIRDLAQKPDRAETKEIATNAIASSLPELSKAIRAVEMDLLAVPEDLQQKYAAFLKESGTGILKLLPRGRHESVMTIRGAGAYYSFVNRTHEYGNGSDIELQGRNLTVGFAGLDFGFFVPLGEIPIERLLLADEPPPPGLASNVREAWKFSWTYAAPTVVKEARCEAQKFQSGMPVATILLGDTVPASEGRTYLLRSIGYRESDVLVLFHVEKQLDDGSVVIAWRLLRQFDTPRAIGPEPEPNAICS